MKIPMSAGTIPMSEVRAGYAKLAGPDGHWFDADAARFFRSILPKLAFYGPGGVYFVTSEQFVGSDGVAAPRRYTVRAWHGGRVDTVGEFNTLSRNRAVSLAEQLSGGLDVA